MADVRGYVDDTLWPLVDQISGAVDSGIFAQSAVLEVRLAGEKLLSCAIGIDGIGDEVTTDSIFSVYCTTKPVIALALGVLVSNHELSWDDCLGDVVAATLPADLAGVMVGSILTHTAGLHLLRAEQLLIRSSDDRLRMACAYGRPPDWSSDRDLAYSNYLGWYWLLRVIEGVTQHSALDYIDKEVIEPLELSDDVFIGVSGEQEEQLLRRCAVNVDLTGDKPVPMLLERAPSFMREYDRAAAGGYATAKGLCALYESLYGIITGANHASHSITPSVLGVMTSSRVEGRFDQMMRRVCSWGLGFMTDLTTHKFGDHISTRSFGHSGNAGASFAFCDVERGLSVAVVYGAKIDDQIAVNMRRVSLLNRLYCCLGFDRSGS